MPPGSQEEDFGLKVAVLTSDGMPTKGEIHADNSCNGICECHDLNCRDSRKTRKGLIQVMRPNITPASESHIRVTIGQMRDHWPGPGVIPGRFELERDGLDGLEDGRRNRSR